MTLRYSPSETYLEAARRRHREATEAYRAHIDRVDPKAGYVPPPDGWETWDAFRKESERLFQRRADMAEVLIGTIDGMLARGELIEKEPTVPLFPESISPPVTR